MNRNKILIFGVVGGILLIVLIFVIGFVIKGASDGDSVYETKATLDFWGVGDRTSAYQTALNRFKELYPNVTISYRMFDNVDDYESALLNALAAGEGPDIFVIMNDDLPRKANKIFPLPSSKYSVGSLRADFPDIVEDDFVSGGNIYALPVSIDTLALIYNRDLFNEAAVVFPPSTWDEFQKAASKLTEFGEGGIIRSGAAIGTSENIGNSTDILSLIMIQSGVHMVNDDYTGATFNSSAGREALEFYLQFSNENSGSYAWNDGFPEAVESFAREKTAILLGYSGDLKEAKERNPLVNVETAEIPQVEGGKKASLARYFGYTVSRQTLYPSIAWDFIRVVTADLASVRSYLESTDRPPALRYLIDEYKNDPMFGVFSRQALVAEDWKRPDPEKVDGIFDNMIDAVREGRKEVSKALSDAQNEVSALMKRSF